MPKTTASCSRLGAREVPCLWKHTRELSNPSQTCLRVGGVLKMTWQALACELENLENQVGAAAQQLAWALGPS